MEGRRLLLFTRQNCRPLVLFPLALTGGLYIHKPIRSGITRNMTPDTPLLPGRPT